MKITKSKLKQIIKEELQKVLSEESDLPGQVKKLYDQWKPKTSEGELYKQQLGKLL